MKKFVGYVNGKLIYDEKEFNEHLEENDMLNIKTIYLPVEENYDFPSSDGHRLSKSCMK